MKKSVISILGSIGLVLIVLGLSINASALPIDSTTIYLSVPNTGLSPYTGPYASIEIDLMSSTTASVIATGLTSGNLQYLLGGNGALDLSTLGGSATASGFSWTGGNNKTSFSQGTSGNISEFGNFNVVIDGFDGFKSAVNTLNFSLVDNSATTWSSALGVLTLNDKDFLAAGHIFVKGTACAEAPTGYAGNGSTKVPEPGMLVLLGSGILGLGLFGRKKFRK